MKVNKFRGDFTDVSAKNEALDISQRRTLLQTWWVV